MTPASDVDLRDDASTAGSSLPQPLRAMWRTIYWTYERATWQYDLMVIAILAFVWLTPPDWLRDPMASGPGLIGWMKSLISNP
jgi:hypothetical protein